MRNLIHPQSKSQVTHMSFGMTTHFQLMLCQQQRKSYRKYSTIVFDVITIVFCNGYDMARKDTGKVWVPHLYPLNNEGVNLYSPTAVFQKA